MDKWGGRAGDGGVRVDVDEEVFVKNKKKNVFGVRGLGGGGGGQGGCERRFEVSAKIQKKIGGGGVRADVNEELKLLWKWKMQKKYRGWGSQVRPGMGGGGGMGVCR